jgi:hypothetical protein
MGRVKRENGNIGIWREVEGWGLWVLHFLILQGKKEKLTISRQGFFRTTRLFSHFKTNASKGNNEKRYEEKGEVRSVCGVKEQ